MGILEKIVKTKIEELDRYTPQYIKELERIAKDRKEVKDFKKAISQKKVNIIAEVKKASPSKGVIRENFNPVEIAKIYEDYGASAISVLTDEKYFQGSIEYLSAVSKKVNIPVMRKDFIIDERQILEAYAKGADSYLLITRILDERKLKQLIEFGRSLDMEPLVEVFTEEEAVVTVKSGALIVGVNNRDLDTFKVDINKSKKLCPKLKEWGAEVVVAESGISSKKDIDDLNKSGVNAFLIGEALMREEDIGKKLKELIGS